MNHHLSKQRRWQLRKKAEGKCVLCGQPAVTSFHCLKHAVAHRERTRRRLGYRRRYRSKTYRLH